MFNPLSSATNTTYSASQPAPTLQRKSAEHSQAPKESDLLSGMDSLELGGEMAAIRRAQRESLQATEHPKADFSALSSADQKAFTGEVNTARIELQKHLPKSKSQAEKDAHISNYNISLFNAFYKRIIQLLPGAQESALSDWHQLFGSYQQHHAEHAKAKTFNDLSDKAQYDLVSGIMKGLNSPHGEVRQGTLELAESLGMSPEMIQSLRSSGSNT